MECPRFADARLDIFTPKNTITSVQLGDIRFNLSLAPELVLFMRRTGLGFARTLRDRLLPLADGEEEEVVDWDVGQPEALLMDLRL